MPLTRIPTSHGAFALAPLVSDQTSEPIISIATGSAAAPGIVQVDGTTITVNAQGVISATGNAVGSQSPWTVDIVAQSHLLSGVGAITSAVTGAALAFATPANAAVITGAGDGSFHSLAVQPASGNATATLLAPTSGGISLLNLFSNPSANGDALQVVVGGPDAYLHIGNYSATAPRVTTLHIGGGSGSVLTSISFEFNALIVSQILPAGTFSSGATGAALAFATPSNAATITGAGDAVFHSVTTAGPGVISTTSANPNYQLIITQSNASNRAGLDLVNSAGKDFELSIQPNGVCTLTGSPGTYVIVNVASGPGLTLDPTNAILNPSPTGTIFFQTGPAPSSRMTVNAAGNVTINAPDSGVPLTVAGDIHLNGPTAYLVNTTAGGILVAGVPSGSSLQFTPTDMYLSAVGTGQIYQQTNTRTRLSVNSAGQITMNAADSGSTFIVTGMVEFHGLPSVLPAAGSKQLWYDPADNNRVKYAV